MSDDQTTLDTRKLDQLIKSLSNVPEGRVGILGGKNARKEGNSNATIGYKHEFGDEKLPIRSFLRMPITEQMQKYLDKSGAFTKESVQIVMQQQSLVPWIKKICVLAEGIIADAFASGGFGKWKPSNMKYKKVHQTLVESQQLSRSITSEVK